MMSESELITLGWRYELAKPERAKTIRQEFKNTLDKLGSEDLRAWFVHLFEQGRQEARRN